MDWVRPRTLGVIPVRVGSTRLPEKPLHPILGRPLVEWVWRRAVEMSVFDALVVATDSPRVEALCNGIGAEVRLTSSHHPSGTDRVAEVAAHPDYSSFPIVVNLQGDEPLMEKEHVERAVALVAADGWEVGTCATPLLDEEKYRDSSAVKVVVRGDGGALYFSRSPIPFKRDGEVDREDLASPRFLRHLGLYSFRREALSRWVALPPSHLEALEQLEQLRALEAGIRIGVALVGPAHGGVDTLADVARVERELSSRGADSRMAAGHDG